ncbi:MAG: hypothetical protein ACOYN5_09025 [Bacteroidales bacterium]
MKNYCFSLLFMSMFFVSCQKEKISASGMLDRLNWSDKNFEVLSQLIKDYGVGGNNYDTSKPSYVVLDWDQTCAHFDVEEAVMRFQLFHLRFKLTKEQFAGLFKDEIQGITRFPADYYDLNLADINQDIKNEYNYLYDNYIGPDGTLSFEEIQMTPQYKDFIVKIPVLYEGYCVTPGIEADYAYPWVLFLLAGHTMDEVKVLANEAIAYELGNQLSKQILNSPAGFQTIAGNVSYSYKTGLRVFPEMQNLISTFKDQGIEVFIVSASYKPVVEVFSGIGTYGYNVREQNVIAMELAIDGEGKILPEYKAGWIKTQRQGKVDAINMVIKSGLGKNWDPIFSAADSDGDYEMSTMFPDMKLSLIWNRVKGGDIGKLCKQAVEEMNSEYPRYILQGRNENTGTALPGPESILLGKTEPQLLY